MKNVDVSALLIVALFGGGCVSVETTLANSADVVAETDRAWHSNAIEYLGHGCYAVDAKRLYECDTDHEALGQVSCIQDQPGWSTSQYKGLQITRSNTGRCRQLFASRYPPPTPMCDAVVDGVRTRVSKDVLGAAVQSGKGKLIANFGACVGSTATLIKSTGYFSIDAWLRTAIASSLCDRTVIVNPMQCDSYAYAL